MVQCSSKDGDCAACLNTNDTRPTWASPCIFLSGEVEAGHTCAPAKWWWPPCKNADKGLALRKHQCTVRLQCTSVCVVRELTDSAPTVLPPTESMYVSRLSASDDSAAKYPSVHACSDCSDCKPISPPPPPPPCLMDHRPDCWRGTWQKAPKTVPSPKSVDGPLLGNGDVGVVLGASDKGSLTFTYCKTYRPSVFLPARLSCSASSAPRTLDDRLAGIVFNSTPADVSKNDFWFFQDDNIPGRPDSAASYIMGIGGVDLEFPAGTQLVQLEQDISSGSITGLVSLPDGDNITAHTFLSLEGQLITTLSSTGGNEDAQVVSTTWTFGGSGPTTGASGHEQASSPVVWATRTTNSTTRPVEAALATTVVSLSKSGAKTSGDLLSNGGGASHPTSAPPQQILVKSGAPVAVITTVVSSVDAGSLARTLSTALDNAKASRSPSTLQSLQLGNKHWWSTYWNASSIALPTQPQ